MDRLKTSAMLVVAAAAIALGARLDVDLPGTPVPQSAQTLAVLMAGAALGKVRGPAAVLLYLLSGALGAPVFADGRSGLGVLAGPTAGYLGGFVVAAWLAGLWAERGPGRKMATAFLGMLLAHAVILLLGWLWLAKSFGMQRAFESGVAPFVVGGVFKSLLAAAFCVAVSVVRRRVVQPSA